MLHSTLPTLYDWSGAPASSTAAPITGRPGTALASPQGGAIILGSDYGAKPVAQPPRVDTSGNLYTTTMANSADNAPAPNILRTPLLNSGSQNMLVNGVSTTQTFSWAPSTTTASYTITGIHQVISASSIIFQGKYWMALSGGLVNGVLLQASFAGVWTNLATLKLNEDILALDRGAVINLVGSTDFVQIYTRLNHPIAANSGDGVRIQVRDNLTLNTTGGAGSSGTPNMYYYSTFVEGIRLTA